MYQTRVYPQCCTSAFCGRGGDDCLTCLNRDVHEEFLAWVERTKASVTDKIWCPLVYETDDGEGE